MVVCYQLVSVLMFLNQSHVTRETPVTGCTVSHAEGFMVCSMFDNVQGFRAVMSPAVYCCGVAGSNVWHERWGEDYDSSGVYHSLVWQRIAARLLGHTPVNHSCTLTSTSGNALHGMQHCGTAIARFIDCVLSLSCSTSAAGCKATVLRVAWQSFINCAAVRVALRPDALPHSLEVWPQYSRACIVECLWVLGFPSSPPSLWRWIALHGLTLRCTVLHGAALYYILLQCVTLRCAAGDACVKWTDKWAERLLPGGAREQWGDKWHEAFAHGRGDKNGEVRRLTASKHHTPDLVAWQHMSHHTAFQRLASLLQVFAVGLFGSQASFCPSLEPQF